MCRPVNKWRHKCGHPYDPSKWSLPAFDFCAEYKGYSVSQIPSEHWEPKGDIVTEEDCVPCAEAEQREEERVENQATKTNRLLTTLSTVHSVYTDPALVTHRRAIALALAYQPMPLFAPVTTSSTTTLPSISLRPDAYSSHGASTSSDNDALFDTYVESGMTTQPSKRAASGNSSSARQQKRRK